MSTCIKTLKRTLARIILPLCIVTAAHAADDIAAPVILVATQRLAGLPYEQTVLLAVPAGDGQHLGLIANRPTDIDLASVFPGEVASQRDGDPVFFGGPAMSGALFAVIRAAAAPSAYSVSLMPGLFLVTDKDTIDRLLKITPRTARYFTGVVVWGPAELSSEIRRGMWDVQPADANILFHANAPRLWPEFAQPNRHVVAN